MANSLKIVAKIQDLLEEPWKDWALSHVATGITGKRPCLAFRQPLCDQLLRPYVTAPSKAKQAVIIDIASEINRRFEPVAEMEGFDFLSDDDPFQAAIKPVLQEKFPTLESLVLRHHFGEHAFDLAEEGNLVDAVIECSGMYDWDWAYLLLPADEARRDQNDELLAIYVWNKECNNNYEQDALQSETYSKAFVAATSSLVAMKAGIQEYFNLLEEKDVEWLVHARELLFGWRHRHTFLDFIYNKEGLVTCMAEHAANED